MKLPPVALTAPTLCPRCDAPALTAGPALTLEHCVQCDLQLRQCGNCRGVAGPFDRYCGFCGYEILRGARRIPLRALWLLLVLVPLAAGLTYGVAVVRGAIGAQTAARAPAGAEVAGSRDARSLGIRYLVPPGWTAADRSAGGEQVIVLARDPGDVDAAATPQGDLLQVEPRASVLTIGRPRPNASQVVGDSDPAALLTTEVTTLLGQPPAGVQVEVATPVRSLAVGGRPAAQVTLKLTSAGGVQYLERTLIASARAGLPATVRVDARTPAADSPADRARIDAAIAALRFD